MKLFVRHIAGELVNGVQHCVTCGLILTDYRNTVTSEPNFAPKGWHPGPVYIKENMTTIIEPLTFVDCGIS